MKKVKKIAWIRNLMLVSQIMLVIFVWQWISNQYAKEKENLVKELKLQFSATKQEAMDSMIVFKFINPMLKDAKGFKVHMQVEDDTNRNVKIITNDRIESNRVMIASPDSLLFADSLPQKFDKVISLTHTGNRKKDILMQGVKMIYKEVNSISNDSVDKVETLFYSTDTTLLQKLFANRINQSGLQLKYAWINDKQGDSSNIKDKSIYLESNLFPRSYGIEVSDYDPYLLKKLTPQLLFALILILLTGLSFLLAYSSLKNQQKLSMLRNDFISNISHELKTPVSTVKLAIEALQDPERKKDSKIMSEYLEMASIEMNRLDNLIDKVMNTSILEDGKKLVHLECVELNEIINEIIADLKLRFTYLNANISFDSNYQTAYADIDDIHFRGVIINLLDNSLKYGPENPEINIKLDKNNSFWLLNITDNGPGIPEEYKTKVFEKFFRVPTGDTHNVKGYGLGLSYSKLIMEQHNGSITVQNLPQGGCVFTLSIPIAEV